MVEEKILEINNKKIGVNEKTFIIAEIGINHNGNIKTAKGLISEAKSTGADAVKFQTYITEKRVQKDSPIFDILKKCEFNKKEIEDLFNYSKKKGIIFFSTPFDNESVELLSNLSVSLMKIASFDIVNFKLLEKVAKTGIPTIISRGMANREEIDKALAVFKKFNTEYAILHCVSAYPAKKSDVNLNIIKKLKALYHCPIGYSDHTLGIEIPVLSIVAGASIIEKHFTYDREAEGPDHKLSADPNTLREMIMKIRETELIMGSEEIKLQECEKEILQYRRFS